MKHLLLILVFFLPMEAMAQFDFTAIANIEKKNAEAAEVKRLNDIALAVDRAQLAQQKEANKARLARQKQTDKNKAAKEVRDEKQYDKNREQSYEDELRALNLQVLRAKADRTNDYIDSDLAKAAASTDGIQANADRTRMGGTAEIKRAENPVPVNVNVKVKVIE